MTEHLLLSPLSPPTTEESDLLARRNKKYKRKSVESDASEMIPNNLSKEGISFKEAVTNNMNLPSFYVGSDEDLLEDLENYKTSMASHPAPNLEVQNSQWPKIELSLEEKAELWKPWRKALVLKVLGKTVSFKFQSAKLNELWRPTYPFELMDLSENFFLVRFRSKKDYDLVLHEGPWMVMGHYLTINKWRPDFRPANEVINTTMVWVRFPNLPVEYFHEEPLLRCGNMLGKAIKVDKQTAEVSRGKYARVCVELDLNKPLVPFIWVCGNLQPVEYEGLHLICFGCGAYGHHKENCHLLKNPEKDSMREADTPKDGEIPQEASFNKNQDTATFGLDQVESTPFGPWMMAPSHVKRNIQKSRFDGSKGNHIPVNHAGSTTSWGMNIDSHARDKGKKIAQTTASSSINEKRPTGKISNLKGSRNTSVKSTPSGSRFMPLDSLVEEQNTISSSIEVNILAMKQKIKEIPGPSGHLFFSANKTSKPAHTAKILSSKKTHTQPPKSKSSHTLLEPTPSTSPTPQTTIQPMTDTTDNNAMTLNSPLQIYPPNDMKTPSKTEITVHLEEKAVEESCAMVEDVCMDGGTAIPTASS